jgi:RNA polymerase sigma-70 factor (ECF subfamily)
MAAPADERPATAARPDLESLYAEHAAFVQRAVAHLAGPGLDAEDLVQDVFVQACRSWAAFGGRSSVRTWLFGVALGVVRNARRRARFRRFLGLEQVAEPASLAPTPAEDLEQLEDRRTVYATLERLSEKKRTVLVLFELEGLSGAEIAEVLGCPLQTVWTRLHHARRDFARELERSGRAP